MTKTKMKNAAAAGHAADPQDSMRAADLQDRAAVSGPEGDGPGDDLEGDLEDGLDDGFAEDEAAGPESESAATQAAHAADEPNIIDVNHVSIRFNLASQKVDNLKEYAIRLVRNELMFQEFMALKDVDLHIKRGEAWGLIGTNGSGKSTLLKTITGILKPYKGSVKVRGQIAPMIELGAGFDQELSARENIFLNGAVLGHSREFMEEHFDEIVKFAELENFLDSPIKNYSSGMKARLGFAVATCVNPEILIVDEVLSVGDANFRKRCRRRMEEMLSDGTTLLFVSHNVESVMRLCDHAMWLDHGDVIMSGDSRTVGRAYLTRQEQIYTFEQRRREEEEAIRDGGKYDYLIVGAGLTGAVFASRAHAAGKRCLVIDRRDHIGGSLFSENISGINVQRYGAHIFHTDSANVWRYMNRYATFRPYTCEPLARFDGRSYHLPPNMSTFNELWHITRPDGAKRKLLREIEAERSALGLGRPIDETTADMANFPVAPMDLPDDFSAETEDDVLTEESGGAVSPGELPGAEALLCSEWDGPRPRNLEELLLVSVGRTLYETFYRNPIERVCGKPCAELTPETVLCLPEEIRRMLTVRFTFSNRLYTDTWQGYPEGGYTPIIEKLLEGVTVQLRTSYKAYRKEHRGTYRKVIYTGPIDAYFNYRYGELAYRSLRFVSRELPMESYQGCALVEYTGEERNFSRIIEHKHFEGVKSPATIITKQLSEPWTRDKTRFGAVRDEESLRRLALYEADAAKLKKVVFAGRLGTYRNLSMDECITEAMQLSRRMLGRKAFSDPLADAIAGRVKTAEDNSNPELEF